MKCLLPFAGLLLLSHPSGAEKRTIACKTPAVAASCYVTHGRLAVSNGSVNWRLWKIGTHDLLGIYSGPSAFATRYETLDSEAPQLPRNVQAVFDSSSNSIYEVELFANFEVCPLEPHIYGHMQAACIESAKHLVVKK
jgi:hypothetical protein